MRNFFYCLCLLACVCLSVGQLKAQGVTTAAMNGVVLDDKGVPMPGATVMAVHVPSGSKYGYSTRENGEFNFPAVRTGGPYTITVTFIGCTPTVLNDIYLSLGQNLDLSIDMKPSGVDLKEVVVSGKKDRVFNSDRTGASNVVNNRQISETPTLSRSITDVTRLTPQSNGTSFAGRNGLYNNLSIDGSVFNNVFGLSPTPGGQTGSQPISLDAIEEVQVSLAPYDVRQSGFTGAGINAITRSGTNEVKASVYTYWRNQSMVGTKVADTKLTNNNFNQRQSGFRVGAPIIKNKLFLFVNAEMERRDDPATTYLAARPGLSGDNVSKVSASDLDELRQLLISKYNYDPGEYENYKLKTYNDKFLVRLDYNINDKNKFSIRYNYLKSWRDNLPSVSNSATSNDRVSGTNCMLFSSSGYKQYNNIQSVVAELNSVISSKLSNNFIAGYTQFNDYRESPGGVFPMVDILSAGSTMTSFGYEQYSVNNKLKTNVFQISDNLSAYLGSHVLTAGVSYEANKFENGYMPQYYGYYRFSSLDDFKSALNDGNPSLANYQLSYSALAGGEVPLAKLNASQLGVYVQDEWKVNKRVKLTFGVRADMPSYPASLDRNPKLDALTFKNSDGADEKLDVSVLPKMIPLWSPRIGFNIDIFGDRRTQLRGGSGIFTGKIPFVWISNQASNNGLLFGNINVKGTTSYPFTPDVTKYIPANASLPAKVAINTTATGFRFPQVFRSNLAVDQKLPFGIVGTLEGIYSKDINAVYHRNANLQAPSSTLPDGRGYYSVNQINAAINGAYVLDNTDKGYSMFLTAQLQKSFDFGLNLMAAYTYSQTKDATSNPGSVASSAFNGNPTQNNPNQPSLSYSGFDQPHKLVASIGYKIDYLKSFSSAINILYVGSQGNRYSYTYGGDLNGDGSTTNDLMYVPKNQDDIVLVAASTSDKRTPAEIWNQLNAYIEQDDYLKNHRGEIVSRNHSLLPWVNQFDLRFTQDFHFNVAGKRNTLEFTMDVINVGNLLNSDWGVSKKVTKTSFLVPKGLVGGKPTFSFPYLDEANKEPLTSTYVNNTSLASRWQIQLGVRYIFN